MVRATIDSLFAEGMRLLEFRTVGSAATVIAAIIIYAAAPLLVHRLTTLRRYPLVERYAGETLTVLEARIDWPFPTRGVVRIIQTIVLVGAGLAIMGIWGFRSEVRLFFEIVILAMPLLVRFLLTIGLLAGGIIATKLIEERLAAYTAAADDLSAHQEGIAFRMLQLSVFGAVGLTIISLWGVDPTGLIVGAGFLGIVLGMAARQTLGSMIAGLVLMFSRPFEIGDWIKVEDHEGIVTDISIINTRLQSFNSETVVIPNDTVSNRTVVNFSTTERLRLELDVGIEYDTDIEHAESVALEAISDLDDILNNPQPSVVPTSFGDSAIGLRLRFWIQYPSKPKEWQARAAVLQAVKTAFEEADIGIPFPQRELSGKLGNVTNDRSLSAEKPLE